MRISPSSDRPPGWRPPRITAWRSGARNPPPGRIAGILRALVDQLAGVTASARAPAEGEWAEGGAMEHNDIITVEVMVDEIDRGW